MGVVNGGEGSVDDAGQGGTLGEGIVRSLLDLGIIFKWRENVLVWFGDVEGDAVEV